MEIPDWTLLQIEDGNDRVTVRLRTEILPGLGDRQTFTTDVLIKWKYPSPDGGGMPAPAEKARMDDFERQIDDLTEANGNSILMLVATGAGLREWHFYVKNKNAFLRQLNQRLAGRPAYPLEIELYDDPGWQNWRDFMDFHEAP